ncbi:hypothetical protein DXG03_003131 [Asterophora parasitica]|uniref:RRM domain-containing protein n=1 Tax=Asterophora parasitica TaxID=117018 RepID=A0A9P7GJM0_9AGAR|nr:hypothetical protein DXG03_003131 [Asterophora parasitica]
MKATRNHPPRLQHSPSLPNIWFPPHSGPIPPQVEAIISRTPLQRPSTPPLVEAHIEPNQLPPSPVNTSPQTSDHRESLDDLGECLQQTMPLKIQRRRRLDHDQGHGYSLLTPPLTPSSSLRTTTSVDSASNTDTTEYIKDVHGDEADYESTRFLWISNISKKIRHDVLRASIVGSLTSPIDASNSPNNLSVPTSNNMHNGQLSDDSIKGVFLRCQQSDGLAMLAFHDVRHAEIAKKIISSPTDGPLSHCVGDERGEDGQRLWMTCRFITAEQLVEAIGDSPFLASTDGSFYLAVEGRGMSVCDGRELRVVDDHMLAADGELSLSTLKSFLKSFGGLRTFSLTKDKLDGKQPPAKIFYVEYYDARAATSAYTSIDGQHLFGMTVTVFGRDDLAEAASSKLLAGYPAENTDLAKNRIPFPSTPGEHRSDGALPFGPPGQYSHTRERFRYVEDPQARPRSVSAGQDVLVNPIPRSPIPSPTYFYTSNPADVGTPVASEHIVQQNITPGPPPHGAHHDCYYCPSRGSPTTPDCYIPCATPSPYNYQPPSIQQIQPIQNAPFPPHVPPPHVFGHEYDQSYPQPMSPTMAINLNMHMAFEHAMAGVVPRPLIGDHWFSESPRTALRAPHTPYMLPLPEMPMPGGPNMHYPPPNKVDAPSTVDPVAKPFDTIFGSAPPAAPTHPSRAARTTPLQGCMASPREQRATTEHNQLNLHRIEDGQDTRTTVMIKNIPNKMSDKDLIAFIGKVCSRKIDFMYLRMDFQNGCNVGYAFVNFITVGDLLHFAKKKLGERWNMFSSEKVLQMSYANYQGKEALVEKFKNSCIMDEQEAWRPKIFYSEPGPEQGLPEPFPAPTHIRRKERSAYNRGALGIASKRR